MLTEQSRCMSHAARLKRRLTQEDILIAPGVFDALTATIAETAGFEALYLSGAAVAYTRLGRPDIGLTSVSEMADTMALIADRVNVPVIIDADTGFGNALNAQRTLRQYERAGAAALQIEDQCYPKRCGHLSDKALISQRQMSAKIQAMCDARNHDDTLIVARTDAIAVEGFEQALERAEAYLAAGADVLFIEAPQSVLQLQQIGVQFGSRVPLLANMVEGGATPITGADDLQSKGFSLVIYPGGIVRALARCGRDYYTSLKKHGSNAPFTRNMYDFSELNEVLGTADMLAEGERYGGSE